MELKPKHLVGIIIGLIVVITSLFFLQTRFFFFILWMGILIAVFPIVISSVRETKISQEKEIMFLEFTRNLVESVKTGTSISKSLMNLKKKSFGSLTRHIEKLANQISLGIPLKTALEIFAEDVNNKSISRTITLIGQAEKAGGNISSILEEVAKATTMTDKLKKERKSAISSLVSQGYIIFLVFTVIVLVMQFYIIPMLSGMTSLNSMGDTSGETATQSVDALAISQSFLYLLLFQGAFTGLVIGKLSDGRLKSGIKHSFALVVISFLIATVANIILGK